MAKQKSGDRASVGKVKGNMAPREGKARRIDGPDHPHPEPKPQPQPQPSSPIPTEYYTIFNTLRGRYLTTEGSGANVWLEDTNTPGNRQAWGKQDAGSDVVFKCRANDSYLTSDHDGNVAAQASVAHSWEHWKVIPGLHDTSHPLTEPRLIWAPCFGTAKYLCGECGTDPNPNVHVHEGQGAGCWWLFRKASV